MKVIDAFGLAAETGGFLASHAKYFADNSPTYRANEQGQVGVLKDLHDDLDAAVLAAYGWEGAGSKDELLIRLVALNLKRAIEEKTGPVRWLRPEFQNPAAHGSL